MDHLDIVERKSTDGTSSFGSADGSWECRFEFVKDRDAALAAATLIARKLKAHAELCIALTLATQALRDNGAAMPDGVGHHALTYGESILAKVVA